MCGRYVSTTSNEDLAAYFGATIGSSLLDADGAGASAPNFNVAPTTDVRAVVAAPDGSPELQSFRWGLVPSWAKDLKIGSKMINARAETVHEKPAFKGLLAKHRLIVPMDGFYEWQAVAGRTAKQPMFIHRVDGEPLAVAGLWAAWRDRADPEGEWLHSLTIVTTSANATMAPVHDRMPVVLPRERWAEWLDPTNRDAQAVASLLVPAPDDLLTMHPVSTAVNNVRNRGAELVAAVDTATPPTGS